ncbi:hypothetical protein [Sphingobium sp. MK2]|uniref:hypothetical protein n=1 Tax=Sphingobium sp. MK2 TaxID=3116540 RepID=UPI0032E36302
MTLLAASSITDIRFIRNTTARDGDYDSTMVRAGLLRKLLDDAERLQLVEAILPRYIDATQMREIMQETEL